MCLPIGGMIMKRLDGCSLEELRKIKRIVSRYESLGELKDDLHITITSREEEQKKSMNVRFCGEQFYQIFDPWELRVVKANHIMNLQELIDCDLDHLVGITEGVKNGLEWVRKFYDFRPIEAAMQKEKKK